MKRFVVALIAVAALAVPAIASADQTVGIPGFNCSVTAYSPTITYPTVDFNGGVSCGGSQFNYSKQIKVDAYQLVAGGWQFIGSTGWSAWSSVNPLRLGTSIGPCVDGRYYATLATGQVSHAGTIGGNQAQTFGSGTQCP